MENSLEKKSHSCKSWIISMICVDPCEKYYIDIKLLETFVDYKRVMHYIKSMNTPIIRIPTIKIQISSNQVVHIFPSAIFYYKNDK